MAVALSFRERRKEGERGERGEREGERGEREREKRKRERGRRERARQGEKGERERGREGRERKDVQTCEQQFVAWYSLNYLQHVPGERELSTCWLSLKLTQHPSKLRILLCRLFECFEGLVKPTDELAVYLTGSEYDILVHVYNTCIIYICTHSQWTCTVLVHIDVYIYI